MLLIVLIIISLTVIFSNSIFQSGIKYSKSLETLYNKDLSGSRQCNFPEFDKFLCIIKSSRNNFIQKPPFPQR
jgi:hypothetical protein